MKILSKWPWPRGHPRGGDGADKNFRPISTIMPNMNEIHQRVFKIWGLIYFNAKTLTLWRKDERMHERTNKRTNERMYVRTNERKSENYIPPHTSYVGGIIMVNSCPVKMFFASLLKRVCSKRKEFAHRGSKFFPFRIDTFLKGLGGGGQILSF